MYKSKGRRKDIILLLLITPKIHLKGFLFSNFVLRTHILKNEIYTGAESRYKRELISYKDANTFYQKYQTIKWFYRIDILHFMSINRQHDKVLVQSRPGNRQKTDWDWEPDRAAERGSNRWRENERASDLLSEQFTAHTAPQFGSGVGVSFDGWRIVHAAVLLHALTHRVQITVRHHDLCHPDCAPLVAAHKEREGALSPEHQ